MCPASPESRGKREKGQACKAALRRKRLKEKGHGQEVKSLGGDCVQSRFPNASCCPALLRTGMGEMSVHKKLDEFRLELGEIPTEPPESFSLSRLRMFENAR